MVSRVCLLGLGLGLNGRVRLQGLGLDGGVSLQGLGLDGGVSCSSSCVYTYTIVASIIVVKKCVLATAAWWCSGGGSGLWSERYRFESGQCTHLLPPFFP
jgi:hypothetical protein